MYAVKQNQKSLNDVFDSIGNFFENTGKATENANKITERVNKSLDKAFPYLLFGGVLVAVTLITQTSKNIQEIALNNKKLK